MTWDNDLRSWWHLIESCIWTTTQATIQATIKMELVNSSSKIGSLQNHKVRRLIKKPSHQLLLKNSDGFENFWWFLVFNHWTQPMAKPFHKSFRKKIWWFYTFDTIVFWFATIELNRWQNHLINHFEKNWWFWEFLIL